MTEEIPILLQAAKKAVKKAIVKKVAAKPAAAMPAAPAAAAPAPAKSMFTWLSHLVSTPFRRGRSGQEGSR